MYTCVQDMHANGVDTRNLTVRMCELQQAHAAQNRHVQALEVAAAHTPLLKRTVHKQERVIEALEDLLKRAVVELKQRVGKQAPLAVSAAPTKLPAVAVAVTTRGAVPYTQGVEEVEARAREMFELRAAKEAAEREVVDAMARAEHAFALRSAQVCRPTYFMQSTPAEPCLREWSVAHCQAPGSYHAEYISSQSCLRLFRLNLSEAASPRIILCSLGCSHFTRARTEI
jgi:hypothetical protein